MKLKYYLRGFGTGVLFATIILMITFEINENMGSNSHTASSGNLPVTENIDGAESDRNITEGEATTDFSPDTTEESIKDSGQNNETETTDIFGEPDTTTMSPELNTDVPDGGNTETVTFVITSGMISNTAASILEELGVVESGYDFNMYLYNNGYESRLRVGTYEIPIGASYEEIARIITGR